MIMMIDDDEHDHDDNDKVIDIFMIDDHGDDALGGRTTQQQLAKQRAVCVQYAV